MCYKTQFYMVVINGGSDFLHLCFASWFMKKFKIHYVILSSQQFCAKGGWVFTSLISLVILLGLTEDQGLNQGLSGMVTLVNDTVLHV